MQTPEWSANEGEELEADGTEAFNAIEMADGTTIVGMSAATTFGSGQRAFIWRADIGMLQGRKIQLSGSSRNSPTQRRTNSP